MAPNAYQKFSRHSTPHLRVARHTWTARERRATILTIYYTEPTVRQHYIRSDTEIPTLSTLFPDEPYTPADVVELRSHRLRPAELAAMQVLPVTPIALPVTRRFIHRTGAPAIPPTVSATAVSVGVQAMPQVSPAAPMTNASAQTRKGPPYKHWPAYPWPSEPSLPHVGAGDVSSKAQDRFIKTKPHLSDDETYWHGAKYLGHGSYGAVGLWCKTDKHGNVIDRMVVKENAAASREVWRDPKNWRDSLPTEIAVHRRIESRRAAEPEACQHIIKYRGHRLLMQQRRFRLYTDFASGGNLTDAMLPYHSRWDGIQPRHVFTQRHLPEGFIWHTIKALASACLLLETGTTGDAAVEGWKPIFHLDFQTPNILLDVQNKKRKGPADEGSGQSAAGPSKKLKSEIGKATDKASITMRSCRKATNTFQDQEIIPILADFGLSFFDLDFSQGPELDENPIDHVVNLLPNELRYAPEHHHYNPDSPKRLDTKTDVWGIGRIAWSLIVNTIEAHGPVREHGFEDDITGEPLLISKHQLENMRLNSHYKSQLLAGGADWPAASKYSEELKDLVRGCLRFYQEDRPSPRVLLHMVNRHLEAHPHLSQGAMDVGSTLLDLADNSGVEVGEQLVGSLET